MIVHNLYLGVQDPNEKLTNKFSETKLSRAEYLQRTENLMTH